MAIDNMELAHSDTNLTSVVPATDWGLMTNDWQHNHQGVLFTANSTGVATFCRQPANKDKNGSSLNDTKWRWSISLIIDMKC